MKIKIVKRKASSYKELGHEVIEIENVKTLKDLLVYIVNHEYSKQHSTHEIELFTDEKMTSMSKSGKLTFGCLYNEEKDGLEKAIRVMLQDFQDGLFRVYIRQKEYIDLDQKLSLQENDEVVLIRFVMMAGRLW